MATAKQVASSIRKWAQATNLLPPLQDALEVLYVAEVAPAVFDGPAEQILRQRGISSIAYNDTDEAVFVYTKRKVSQKEVLQLPTLIGNCDISFPSGEPEDLTAPPQQTQGAPFSLVPVNGAHFYACGSSISPGNSASAGTLGALVTDADGTLFGLTNNHVTGGCSHSQVGLPVLAPGVLDVAANLLPPFTLGFHAQVLQMFPGDGGNVDVTENTDAAIFKIANPAQVSSYQGDNYDTPTEVIPPEENMMVEKVGRTTRHTVGRIVGRELLPVRVNVSAANHNYQAVILFPEVFVVHGEDGPFSMGGDSGSLVVNRKIDGTLAAIGLLFAGGSDTKAPGNYRTFVLPIGPILDRFGLTLLGGHNAPP
jgi:hypothetical protein